MTELELVKYIGKKVFVYFKDGEHGIYGELHYINLFDRFGHLTRHFYIGDSIFQASSIRKLEENEDKSC